MSEQVHGAKMVRPDFSLVIPVFNEEAVLPELFQRLYSEMDRLRRPYQVVFVDDGSRDRSAALLRIQYQQRPEVTRVVLLKANCGQHNAIIAGFRYADGRQVITLDADLQNPPEEIANLVAKLDEGHDYVGTIRRERRDIFWRHWASRLINGLREKITAVHLTDHGCMLRGYDRAIIQAILATNETVTFIPALAYLFAGNPVEITVAHAPRAAGESKYSLYQLIMLNFDLMTGFSTLPLQVFSMAGIGISLVSFLFVIYLGVRRVLIGPEVEGVFTLFAIMFLLIGIILFGIGLLGEYVGRIYLQTRDRPRFLVRAILGGTDDGENRGLEQS